MLQRTRALDVNGTTDCEERPFDMDKPTRKRDLPTLRACNDPDYCATGKILEARIRSRSHMDHALVKKQTKSSWLGHGARSAGGLCRRRWKSGGLFSIVFRVPPTLRFFRIRNPPKSRSCFVLGLGIFRLRHRVGRASIESFNRRQQLYRTRWPAAFCGYEGWRGDSAMYCDWANRHDPADVRATQTSDSPRIDPHSNRLSATAILCFRETNHTQRQGGQKAASIEHRLGKDQAGRTRTAAHNSLVVGSSLDQFHHAVAHFGDHCDRVRPDFKGRP